jgi:hypothetical protein
VKKFLLAGVALALLSSAASADVFHCGVPQVWPYDNDPNPVLSVDVTYDPAAHSWLVLHNRANGEVISRGVQYRLRDWPGNNNRWTGELNRNLSLTMVGTIGWDNQGPFYQERLYNRSQGDRLDMQMITRCERVRVAPPVVAVPVPVPVAPVAVPVPVAPAQAPAQANGPVQQNGPVVVAPPSSNNVTITIVPGTSYTPTPKVEEKGGS